jgi:hypothetical protein
LQLFGTSTSLLDESQNVTPLALWERTRSEREQWSGASSCFYRLEIKDLRNVILPIWGAHFASGQKLVAIINGILSYPLRDSLVLGSFALSDCVAAQGHKVFSFAPFDWDPAPMS